MKSRHPERDRWIVRLYISGVRRTHGDVSEIVGITPAAVGYVTRRWGATADHQRRAMAGLARALMPQGVSMAATADVVGCCPEALSAYLRQQGVDPWERYTERRKNRRDGQKTCGGCGERKALEEFYCKLDRRVSPPRPSWSSHCKPCDLKRSRKHARKKRERATRFTTDTHLHTSYESKRVSMGAEAARRSQWEQHVKRAERALAHLREARERERERAQQRTHCVACGGVLAPGRIKYCSTRCGWRAMRRLRRARMREAFVAEVDMADIHRRDGGLCQLCGEPVDRRVAYPHPRFPVLDHIIPLSKGGTHEPRNVQLAHYSCNDEKGAGSVGSQLRLVG